MCSILQWKELFSSYIRRITHQTKINDIILKSNDKYTFVILEIY